MTREMIRYERETAALLDALAEKAQLECTERAGLTPPCGTSWPSQWATMAGRISAMRGYLKTAYEELERAQVEAG